ncbi:MAG: exodeoxyribonuclease V subunit gamma, partial [Desulfosudaceae bacterium]
RRYLDDDKDGFKRFQLAEQVAAVLERYLILRPDMIRAWDAGRDAIVDEFPAQRWQPQLWRRIQAELPPEAGRRHPAALHERLRRHPGPLPGLPQRLTVFGMSTLAPFYIDILLRLSCQIAVDIFYLNPCREYWEYAYSRKELLRQKEPHPAADTIDLDVGNSLLASLGPSGREFFSLLLNTVEDTGREIFVDPGTDSLLGAVQADILNLVDAAGRPPAVVSPADESIQIHACHTPMREVEVLHDQLLALFDRHPAMHPRDIVVMMPDVSRYAPLVRAVFDSPEDPARRIPYSIADSSLAAVNTTAAPLLRIVDISRQRYRASDVIDILETAMIRRRFGISETDLDLVKSWVAEAGIRWGIDGPYRESLGLPGFHENTWEFGLERLLLGYPFPAEEGQLQSDFLFAGILPAGSVEGAEARLLGAFVHFVKTLIAAGRSVEQARPAEQWRSFWNRLLDDFFAPATEAEENDVLEIRDILARQAAFDEVVPGSGESLSPAVGRYYLEKLLSGTPRGTGFLSAGVTFGTLLPMRSIPFSVVCLLGMNDGDYPRLTRQPGFDLVDKRGRPGDFSKRNEDRYLFLESLLSARKKLMISYVGQDIHDNSVMPPSVLVNELLDYIRNGFVAEDGGDPVGRLLVRHPLQPFSARYFSAEPRLFSYSRHNCRAAAAGHSPAAERPPFCEAVLPPAGEAEPLRPTLADLSDFFRNPPAFLLKNRLQLRLAPEDNGRPPDREPFGTDALERYDLRQRLLEEYLRGRDEAAVRQVFAAAGRLPHGTPGEIQWQSLHREVDDFAAVVRQLTGGEALPPREIVFSPEETMLRLSGVLSRIYPSGQVFFRCARIKAADLVQAWIFHLAGNALDDPPAGGHTWLAGWDGIVRLEPLPADSARDGLGQLADLFRQGWQFPLPFFPQSALAFAEKADADGAAGEAAARYQWLPGWFHAGESEDPYIRRCFKRDMPADAAFQEIARNVFSPLLAAMTRIQPEEIPA